MAVKHHLLLAGQAVPPPPMCILSGRWNGTFCRFGLQQLQSAKYRAVSSHHLLRW